MDGLLGRKLGHSFSPTVHLGFGNHNYRLFETEDPLTFLKTESFRAINVTLPYKERVIPALDSLDDIAKATGSVNLILRQNDHLVGYNTDYYGLEMLLSHHRVSLQGKKVLILGNGGAAKTVFLLAKASGCLMATKMARHPHDIDEILFSEIDKVADYDIIINTTPAGMFPNNEEMPPIALEKMQHVTALVDLIYNPLQTTLMTQAIALGIASYNGLYMLVAQARKSHELSFETRLPESLVNKVYSNLKKRACNLVLIGLPLSGKTMYSRRLAEKYQKTPVDTDAMIEATSQMPISEIFRTNGEPYFRALETSTIEQIYRLGNQVISTGGGMIENPSIMARLKQNGILIFLDKDPQKIMQLKILNRPLIQTPEDILRLSEKRRPLYEKYADIAVKIEKPIEDIVAEIEVKINEYLHY